MCDRLTPPSLSPVHRLAAQSLIVMQWFIVIQRGHHDIENEMVFQSNPTYIFHDSRGFEAGGINELKKVKEFVSERSKAKKLQDQVHVIWYVK